MNQAFAKDVDEGLSASEKHLSSKYFYDEIGDGIFIEIMHMPEYYLTNAELEIFQQQTEKIILAFNQQPDTHFELIELGAGDGTKTKEILKKLIALNYTFDYIPVDISHHALDDLQERLSTELADLSVKTRPGDYFEVLNSLRENNHPKIIFFLGSNIGNLEDSIAKDFMCQLDEVLNSGDKVLLGTDLIKSKDIVLPAYNDAQGITARFNLNLLTRINRELDADFKVDAFQHLCTYEASEGVVRSFLVSKEQQQVSVGRLNKKFNFNKGERIHTETSRKYNDDILNQILEVTNIEIAHKFVDSNNLFADYILNKK